MEKVISFDDCWHFAGFISTNGYGEVSSMGKKTRVHRAMYEAFKGKIPEGWYVDHLCRVRHCVNPDHLEAVTPGVNAMRGLGIPARNARKTHCLNGHALIPENLVKAKKKGRICNICSYNYLVEWRKKRKLLQV